MIIFEFNCLKQFYLY